MSRKEKGGEANNRCARDSSPPVQYDWRDALTYSIFGTRRPRRKKDTKKQIYDVRSLMPKHTRRPRSIKEKKCFYVSTISWEGSSLGIHLPWMHECSFPLPISFFRWQPTKIYIRAARLRLVGLGIGLGRSRPLSFARPEGKKMEEWVDGVWPRERMGHSRYGKWPSLTPRTQASCMHSSQRETSLPH